MHFLMFPLGTRGDVNPLLHIGARLKSMNHDVTVVTLEYFRCAVENSGLTFEPLVPGDDYETRLKNPRLWHSVRGFGVLMDHAMEMVPPVFDHIGRHAHDSNLVVVSGPLSLGTRIAWEKYPFKLVTLCLQPVILGGVRQMPRYSAAPGMASMPVFFRKSTHFIMNRIADALCCPRINAFRKHVGITPPVRNFLIWWLSPQPLLGLFPDWYGPPRDDQVAQAELTGFPLPRMQNGQHIYDSNSLHAENGVPVSLRSFIETGSPPLVCTFGTGMFHGNNKYAELIRFCRESGFRAVLVGPDTESFNGVLPGQVQAYRYVNFPWLLSRSRAIIHHGGIGTVAESVRAGIPQLIVPMTFDQPDNAFRVKKLGLGNFLWPRHFLSNTIATELRLLLNSNHITESCRRFSQVTIEDDGLQNAGNALVKLGST